MTSLKEIQAILDTLNERLEVVESRIDGLEDKLDVVFDHLGRIPE